MNKNKYIYVSDVSSNLDGNVHVSDCRGLERKCMRVRFVAASCEERRLILFCFKLTMHLHIYDKHLYWCGVVVERQHMANNRNNNNNNNVLRSANAT